jgi:hypothetical protein
MGGADGVVEIDETYIGKLDIAPKGRKKPGSSFKNIVLTLVERGGSARSFHIDATTLNEITKIVRENVHRETIINTDEGRWYNQLGGHFLSYDAVNHSRYEYVHHHQHGGRLLFDFQTRHEGHLSALRREASAPLSGRI